METIDIQNKAFVVRWVKCMSGDTINYQVKPLKKSIELGIYKKLKIAVDDHHANPSVHIAPNTRAVLDYTSKALQSRTNLSSAPEDDHHSLSSLSISAIQQQSQEGSLRDRLAGSGFALVKWVGHIDGNKMIEGAIDVMDNDYYYAFILDNTSSKNVKKKVLFNASTINDDVQSLITTRSAPSPTVGSFPSLSSAIKDSPVVVGQGRYLQGYLMKKRRKKLQGFKRRFFTLDFRYGTLSYYMNDHNQTRRGEIVISLSTVSANKKDKLIIIDSGMEIWALKSRDTSGWQVWVDALQSCFEQGENESVFGFDVSSDENEETIAKESISSPRTIDNKSYIPLPNEAYEDFGLSLKIIQQRIEQCKNESLSYKLKHKESRPSPRHRSSSSSSSIMGKIRVKTMSTASPNASTESLSQIESESSESTTSNEHELYSRLADLEDLFNQFVKQSKVLTADHLHLTKKIKEKTNSSIYSAFSDNDEFFDAMEVTSHGVILLDDDNESHEYLDHKITNNDNDNEIEDSFGNKFQLKEPALLSDNKLNALRMKENIMLKKDEVPASKSTKSGEISVLSNIENVETEDKEEEDDDDLYPLPITKKVERRNDVKPTTSTPPSLLSFLRKNVGKDLSSVAMPVTSNEPLTILQTLTEFFEYASLLGNLAEEPVPLIPVTAFAISYLSTYRDKTRTLRKPFNPLLGETFELVDEKNGFRIITEKVSHKPQTFAFHVDHKDWECSYTLTPVQKFWGKSVELNNEGNMELKCKATGEYFEWSQPTTMLKNLIAGERYVEPTNEFEVISSKSGKVTVSFEKSGMFGGRSEGVTAMLTPKDKKQHPYKIIEGKWTEQLKDIKNKKVIWKAGELLKNPKEKYGYTKFASNLNDITVIEKDNLPPTDSRLRPDVRAYENGNNAEAEALKLKLEKDQRERRQNGNDIKPQFFVKSSANKWTYKRGNDSYWNRRKCGDWSNLTPLW
ncbi:oxysterol-binding protein homolog 3 [Monosporozyma servazzii]